MLPNNRILLNWVLRPKLLNNPFASCSFVNLDFLLPHTANFGNNIVLPFLVFNTFESTFSCLVLITSCSLNPRFLLNLLDSSVLQSIIISIAKSSSKKLLLGWFFSSSINSYLWFLWSEWYFLVRTGKPAKWSNPSSICFSLNYSIPLSTITATPLFSHVS